MTTPTARPVLSLRIEEEVRSSYLDYAMSVIVARALPDVRDGLKPVHRRILYAMQELGLAPNQPHKKSARIVGEVLGKYHPHGDAPVYDALVRMAQDFSMRYPLVNGQGNFGSVDDDPPAAMRYTEARLATIAQEMLADIERETVDFTANFDGSLQEPVILPARIPNLLINGASGIAVGMTTNIPPHNLREVAAATVHLIDHPDAGLGELMRFVPGPDFPTGGIIRGQEGVINALSTGHGRILVEARAEVVEGRRSGRTHIVITELPYQVNKAALVKKIATAAKERRIEGITDVRDESDRQGLRVVVEVARDASPEYILRNLYLHTSLRTAFHVNMLALVDGAPRVVNLKQVLTHYINFRREVIERRARYDLRRARERAHLLEGLRIAIQHLDEVIALIRAAADVEAARNALMERYSLTHPQAQAILDMQLRRLSTLERRKLEEEYRELQWTIAELEALLADPARVLAKVKEETQRLAETYGDPRRTQIDMEEVTDLTKAELLAASTPHQRVVVLLTQRGYIKRMPLETFRRQHRGGKGIRGLQTRDGDRIQRLHVVDTHDLLLFFTNKGKVYSLECFHLPQDESRTSKGKPLVNVVPHILPQERIQAVMTVKEVGAQGSLVLATRRGEAKRLPAAFFHNIRSNGLICMDLEEGDEVVSVRPALESDEVLMFTQNGKAARFPVASLRQRSRYAGGVRGIRLPEGDVVVGMDIAVKNGKVLIVSERGYGKFTPVSSFPTKGRGAQGVLAQRINAKTGRVAAALVVKECEELVAISSKNKVIRAPVNTIRSLGRHTQGVRIMDMDDDATVVSVDCWESKAEPSAPPPPKARSDAYEKAPAAPVETPESPEEPPARPRRRGNNGHQLSLGLASAPEDRFATGPVEDGDNGLEPEEEA